jgi:SNARE protein 1
MAKQFKRNALHLSTLLEKDKAVVEDAQLKLEVNHDMMQKERVRLRDHTSKNQWTTCFTLGVVMVVLLVFLLMVSVIRFS